VKHLAKITTLPLLLLSLALFSPVAKADTLSFVGVNGSATPNGAEYTGPYTISVDGTNLQLFCLDMDRNIDFGETWIANASQLSSNSPLAEKEAAILFSLANINQLSNVDAQLEIWAILDPNDARAAGLKPTQENFLTDIVQASAQDPAGQYDEAFYSQFTLFTAAPGSQSNGGTAQDFLGYEIPVAPTPEPSSLLLLGTGLFGSAGILYRHARSK
jgi:PEP-CTERM motif